MDNLPIEINHIIISYLRVKDISTFTSVSKSKNELQKILIDENLDIGCVLHPKKSKSKLKDFFFKISPQDYYIIRNMLIDRSMWYALDLFERNTPNQEGITLDKLVNKILESKLTRSLKKYVINLYNLANYADYFLYELYKNFSSKHGDYWAVFLLSNRFKYIFHDSYDIYEDEEHDGGEEWTNIANLFYRILKINTKYRILLILNNSNVIRRTINLHIYMKRIIMFKYLHYGTDELDIETCDILDNIYNDQFIESYKNIYFGPDTFSISP